jgi:hypothetical protein
VPTARSWTDEWRGAFVDLRHLLWFRACTVRRRRPAAAAAAVLVAVTLASAAVPAWWPTRDPDLLGRVTDLLPAYLLALVLVTTAAAVASGGGRELLARDPAAVHPIGPLTDHLGSLALAPLSAAWLLQTWVLLGATSFLTGPRPGLLVLHLAAAAAWVAGATAFGQLVGWIVEWVRHGPHGAAVVRVLIALGVVVATVGFLPALRGSAPDVTVTKVTALALLVVAALLVVLGGYVAGRVVRRPARAESRIESRAYAARLMPRSAFSALVRTDRSSVWRSVSLRRGALFLALAPGTAALLHPLEWDTILLLPGLVASGCILLFGVNVWCLDGRGLLWRETLPVPPSLPLAARSWVVGELLLGAMAVTITLAALTAGPPSGAQLVALVASVVVVTGQGLSGGLRWSSSTPYAVDLRSPRATPAPPLAMVGYSVRLAVATTLTSMLLGGFARVGRPDLVLLLAGILLAWSVGRIAGVRRRWLDPVSRAGIVAVVAA